jgi:ribosome-interacting GTPase 1
MLGRINYGISSTFEDLLTEIINRRNSYSTFVVVTPKVFTSYIDKLNKLSKASTKVILISLESINMDKLDKGIIKYGVKL